MSLFSSSPSPAFAGVTLHLTPKALVSLSRTLRQASAQLRSPDPSEELEAALWAMRAADASPS